MNGAAGLVAAAAAIAGNIAYGVLEARRYRLRSHRLDVLPAGASSLSVLQISDTHLRADDGRLEAFLTSLGDEEYDLVVATGDLLGEPAGLMPCARALNRLAGRYGRLFVLGSSDYYAPKFRSYFDYFTGRRGVGDKPNRTEEFRSALCSEGWLDLTNRNIVADLAGTRTQITGLDDPYLGREDRSLLHRDQSCGLAICIVHDPAPYLDAAKAGYDLIISGHTHGGQVRLPFVGALVTNSELPPRLARWSHQVGESTLFVSPGLGTGKYAPFRYMCPPEASLLELRDRGRS